MSIFEIDAENTENTCDLYTDFQSNEFESFAPSRMGKHGDIIDTREEIIAEINSIINKPDIRPKVIDRKSGCKILIDSGAAISCWPKSMVKNPIWDPGKNLVAMNGSQIKTFGERTIQIQLGTVTFAHNFVISEVDSPVLGFDFMSQQKVDLIWTKQGRCILKSNRKTIHLTMAKCSGQHLNLAPITTGSPSFQKWVQEQRVKNIDPPTPIPTGYQAILDKFPGIDKPNFVDKPKHGVVHHIITKGPPV